MGHALLPLLASSLLLAACAAPTGQGSGQDDRRVVPPPSVAASPATDGTSKAPASSSADDGERAGTVTLAFAGDVHFARQLAPLLQDSDETWATRLPELAAADFAMVNLETAVTERGRPEDKKYTFRASPVALSKLAAAGIDAVSMANNHAADYGMDGIEDTLAAKASSPIPIVGFGKDDAEAYRPLSLKVKGLDVGVIAATEVVEETYRNHSAGPGTPGVAQNVERERFTQEAREAVADNDLVVAYVHWGTEGTTCPNEHQKETARILADAGVDVIVGTHAHRPQGAGWGQDGAFIGYGTGNFVWYNTSLESRSSGVLTLTVDADRARSRGKERGGPSVVTGYTWAPKLISTGGVPETPTASMTRLQGLARQATACSGLVQQPSTES